MKVPTLKEFRISESPFPVVDPSTLPDNIVAALDIFMMGRTVSHPIYIYKQDWQEFCGAVERNDIKI
ncbi:hypothetical protein [Vibrio agarivorans]|uniref:hypothetical protein n=1 Tax=Vibrio agarivorans TaxID=153622 RepID=UPI002232B1E8|nr:hypothetical protein [Vibrio agarivorans]